MNQCKAIHYKNTRKKYYNVPNKQKKSYVFGLLFAMTTEASFMAWSNKNNYNKKNA